jgi:hypothetical protein
LLHFRMFFFVVNWISNTLLLLHFLPFYYACLMKKMKTFRTVNLKSNFNCNLYLKITSEFVFALLILARFNKHYNKGIYNMTDSLK